jgi:hypothetical protein
MGIGDLAGKHAAGSEREMAELQLGAARTTCEDAFVGHRDSPAAICESPRAMHGANDRAEGRFASPQAGGLGLC